MYTTFDNQPAAHWRWEVDAQTCRYCQTALARGRRHMTHKWVATCGPDGGRVKVEVTIGDLRRMADLVPLEKAA